MYNNKKHNVYSPGAGVPSKKTRHIMVTFLQLRIYNCIILAFHYQHSKFNNTAHKCSSIHFF